MASILEKIYSEFPNTKNVFLDKVFSEKMFADQENAMHFILSFKHLPDPERRDLEEIMRHCGAEISSNIDETSDFSAIIVDHDVVVSTKAPAFTFYFLRDCLKAGKMEDINKYRQNATRHIADHVDFMNVVFHRRTCWSSVLTEEDKLWLRDNLSSITTEECHQSRASSNEEKKTIIKGCYKIHEYKEKTPPKETHFTLSDDDDSDLDEPVCSNVERNIFKSVKNIEESCDVQSTRNRGDAAISFDSKDPFDDDLFSSRKENKITFCPALRQSFTTILCHYHSCPHLKHIFCKYCEEAYDENMFNFKKAQKVKLPYSQEEKEKILKYIIHYQGYSSVKGRDFWKIMERRKVCPNRTWQSMKEHFLKKLVLDLDSFDFLSDTEKNKIKYALG